MKSSNCEYCKDYVSLVEAQLTADDYCNKHKMWLGAVEECSMLPIITKEPVEHAPRLEGV